MIEVNFRVDCCSSRVRKSIFIYRISKWRYVRWATAKEHELGDTGIKGGNRWSFVSQDLRRRQWGNGFGY